MEIVIYSYNYDNARDSYAKVDTYRFV